VLGEVPRPLPVGLHTRIRREFMKKNSSGKRASWKKLEEMFKKYGYDDYQWINPKGIVVAQWARMKCMFGCKNFGKCGTCPPNTPSVEECEAFFRGYKTGVVFHFGKRVARPEDRFAWTRKVNLKLLNLEREVFLSGYYKAFLLFMDSCYLCASCPGVREKCKNPKMSRPTPESMAVDVFATVRKIGYPIKVLYDYSQEMNRYAFLLIE
jgi:predicted metal-binding protein